MRIAVLTYYRVANFGANLQALSTYAYLKKEGHDVEFIEYVSKMTQRGYKNFLLYYLTKIYRFFSPRPENLQEKEHIRFVDDVIPNQKLNLHSSKEVREYLLGNKFDGVIIGSDAVTQHWPVFSTMKLSLKRPYWFEPIQPERKFPNPFWGDGFCRDIPTAMMSVSSQNSPYKKFSSITKRRISSLLKDVRFISVRDSWTKNMMLSCDADLNITITPDPVFALNQNLGDMIPNEKTVREKFGICNNYVLIGLRKQVFSVDFLRELKDALLHYGLTCIAFPISGKVNYQHPFDTQIDVPLSPLDWYALIKYSSGYIGSNMHPIVSCLANSVPCFSIDNWGTTNFWGKKIKDGSSKVLDILKRFKLDNNRKEISDDVCDVSPDLIVQRLIKYPHHDVQIENEKIVSEYNTMMFEIIKSFKA